MNFPYGDSITLKNSTTTVTFEDNEFRPQPQNSELEVLGYTRYLSVVKTTKRTILGYGYWEGPQYESTQWAVSLQRITTEKLDLLLALYQKQQTDLEDIILLDRRIAVRENSPRTRAKVGELILPAPPNRVYYWGVFKVELDLKYNEDVILIGRECGETTDLYLVKFGLKELELLTPSGDLP